MQLARRIPLGAIVLLGTLALSVACSGRDALIQPPVLSPLAGLNESAARDSSGGSPPTGAPQPGDLSGTVVGPSPVGSGGDTLATAPRVAGVEITVYQVIESNLPVYPPMVGPPIASTISGVDGKFALPGLPGGPIVVTFEPPSSGAYAGTWSSWVIHANSGDYPWWVVLPLK
jgi:hypothetical protein